MRREFPIVIKKTGLKLLILDFPITLFGGDQLVIAKEERGSQVPEGETWKVSGYTNSGPAITVIKEEK